MLIAKPHISTPRVIIMKVIMLNNKISMSQGYFHLALKVKLKMNKARVCFEKTLLHTIELISS